MSDQYNQLGRPLHACEMCSVVYARYQAPEECRVCGNDSFVEVQVKGHSS